MKYEIPYNEKQSGVFEDRPDFRDKQFSEVAGATVIDWVKGYDVEKDLGIKLKVENQNGSLSCVGQTFEKYGEVLNYVDSGELVDLSAKFLYGQIYLPEGGAYLRDAAKLLVNKGCAEESIVPSYMSGNPPTELFMRNLTLNQEILNNATKYQAKEYRNVAIDINQIASAIETGYGMAWAATGSNPGWTKADVRQPLEYEVQWGHAIYATGYGMRKGQKAIKFINSWGKNWGEDGYGYINEEYFERVDIGLGNWMSYLFNGWTIIDIIKTMTFKKEVGNPNIYLINEEKKTKTMIIDMVTLELFGGTYTEVSSLGEYRDAGTLALFERIIT